MKFVLINGPSCSGKSSIIKTVLKEKDRYFHLSYDALKWSFSHYEAPKHYKEVQEIVRAVAATVCGMKYNMISDAGLYKASREKLFKIARAQGYEIIEINFEAEYDMLLKRFEERVAQAKATPERKISNLSVDRFKELYDIYQSEKNPNAILFKTDEQNSEEIVSAVLKLL